MRRGERHGCVGYKPREDGLKGENTAVIEVLGSAAVGLFIWWLGVRYGRKEKAEDRREKRIAAVVDRYAELAHSHPVIDAGPMAFKKAGAGLLKSDAEIREAVRQLTNRYGNRNHPLGARRLEGLPCDLKDLFRRLDPDAGNLRKLLDECE